MDRNFDKFLIGSVLVLVLFYFGFLFLGEKVEAQNVTVTATVTTTVSCTLSTTTTAFGTIGTASIYTSSPNVTTTVSCNPAAGCTVQINDQGSGTQPGLWNSSASYLIPSPDAAFNPTAALSAGTKGYGIQSATTTAGTGATLTLNARYNQTGNTVGGLTTTTIQLASSTSPTANREVVVTHKVAVDGLTPAGSYSDTITYTCVSN